MPDPRLIVTSCGTSLLTNRAPAELQEKLNRSANARGSDLPPDLKREFEAHKQSRRDALMAADLAGVRKMSAELNGILGVYGGALPAHRSGSKPDHHILVHTDTYLGEATAGVIRDWMKANHFVTETVKLSDFRTSSLQEIRYGAVSLVHWCEEVLPRYRQEHYRVIFNLTGGFKVLQGLFQTVGSLLADEVVYIFETSGELLHIPRLPIRLDAEVVVREHLPLFRRLARGDSLSSEECRGIPELYLFECDGRAMLSEWGQLVWGQTGKAMMADEIFPPLTNNLTYSKQFGKDWGDLEPRHRIEVNQTLEQFQKHLEGGALLKSDKFKPLQGNPRPPSTHELYGWSDGAAGRIFLHNEGGAWVVDGVGKHL